jgi:hypothetical protein
MKTLQQAIDATVFITLLLFANQYHAKNPNSFDIVALLAALYVMLRRRDINTLSLISLMLIAKVVESVVFYDLRAINPYLYYAVVAGGNAIWVRLVHLRFMLLFRYGPRFFRHNKALTFTHQDAMIGWLYSATAGLAAVTLVEHSLRHLAGLNIEPMFFYTLYQPGQLLLAVATIVVLYLMTYPRSAEARVAKTKESLDA